MKANEVFDCIYTRPFSDDDYSLNDYINQQLHDVSWRLFERQQDICFNIVERNPPMLKNEAPDIIFRECRKAFNWVYDYMTIRLLISYRLNNIDLGEEGEWTLRDALGDEEYEEFEKAARKYIFEDYAKNLGVDKAISYFKKIDRPEFIAEVKNE